MSMMLRCVVCEEEKDPVVDDCCVDCREKMIRCLETELRRVEAVHAMETKELRRDLAILRWNKNRAEQDLDFVINYLDPLLQKSEERCLKLENTVRLLLRSAYPNERDHPTMWAAWRAAEEALEHIEATRNAEIRKETKTNVSGK